MTDSNLPQIPNSRNNNSGTVGRDPQEELRFPPVRNGVDYLRSVVELLDGDPDPRDLKYAVLHLQAATEVLLKARLVAFDWRLVFAKVDEADEDAYRRGDFNSCNMKDAIKRLRDQGIEISPEDKGNITHLGQQRNRLQHYGLTDSVIAVETRAAKALDFLLNFVHDHLVPRLGEAEARVVEREMDVLRPRFREIRSLVTERSKRLPGALEAHLDYTVVCRTCGEWALVTRGDPACRSCHETWEHPTDAACWYMCDVLGVSFREAWDAIKTCPVCEIKAVVPGAFVASSRDTAITLCFTCAWRVGLMMCIECGELVPQDGEGVRQREGWGMCNSCRECKEPEGNLR
ncbi:hypothetical protein ACIQ7Q_24610 [Streptomyces sp. NPDC096176]|uniref:hypothetical protein n=1 Tax=Streptomyces sp. NPDC096176 TaxID=3366079 RepID=UPI003825F4AF